MYNKQTVRTHMIVVSAITLLIFDVKLTSLCSTLELHYNLYFKNYNMNVLLFTYFIV